MIAYKLLRQRNDGTLGPLFVGRDTVIPVGTWMRAQMNLPHPGLAHRPGYHCCSTKRAPHIKLRLKNGEQRVWCTVEVDEYTELKRPETQGGLWYISNKMKVLDVLPS